MAVNLAEITSLIENAQKSADVEKEVRKALTRVENLMGAVNQEIQHIYQLFDGAVEPKAKRGPKPKATSGDSDTKADGTPKKKPGRKPKAEAAAE